MNLQTNPTRYLIILSLFIFAACGGDDDEAVFVDAPNPPNVNSILASINLERSSEQDCSGNAMPAVSALTVSSLLNSIAETHSEFMNSEEKLTDKGENDAELLDRLLNGGYNATVYVENRIAGAETEDEAISLWLSSEEQCMNIMNADVTEMGVGTAGPYWTLILAKPQ